MNIKEVIKHANDRVRYVPQYEAILNVVNGELLEHVQASLSQELSPEAYNIASKRISSINVLRRIVKKLSRSYLTEPFRYCSEPSDLELVREYTVNSEIDEVMNKAETLLNTNRHFALEPYIEEGKLEIRVLAPHEFTVYSDNQNDPTSPTALIKFMGSEEVLLDKLMTSVNIYWIYTDEQFIICDSSGEVRSVQPNPFGEIPFVYANDSEFELQPDPDQDSYANAVLIPKLLTDLNYAVQFQSHSIMYGIDIDAKNIKGTPDSLWAINSQEGENKKPQIGILSPQVQVDKVLGLVNYTIAAWLDTRGVRVGTMSSTDASSAASGVSKIIDESDATALIKENQKFLRHQEQKLWSLIAKFHNLFMSEMDVTQKAFSEPLYVSINYDEIKPIPNPTEERAKMQFLLDNHLTTRRMLLQELYPNHTEEELDKLEQELDAQKQASMQDNQPILNQENKNGQTGK